MAERAVEVFVQAAGESVLAGRLWSHRRRGGESTTFAYDAGYLGRPDAYELDPALKLVAGQQQTPAGRAIFGAFSDCAPDRWGRRLIARAQARRVQRDGGAPRSFGEIDYLLGVRDDLRQGALRFRDPESGVYLAEEQTGVPLLLDLPKLLGAAERLERDEAGEEELRTLLRGGSSLGGSRPKAHVLDRRGRVAIAKFPSSALDDWDVTRWEAVALTLARAAGIGVPDWTLEPIDGKPVLIADRFDRAGERRIGYASAMTLLEASDSDRGSYLDIADAIERESPKPERDLEELWRRIAFSILISNTDDHLRNHGFLRAGEGGWTLSPAFDLNPDPRPGPKHLHTAIDLDDTSASVDTLMSVAGDFRLGREPALRILAEVGDAVGQWSSAAEAIGLKRTEIEQMRHAFDHEQADRARRIALGGRPRPRRERRNRGAPPAVDMGR
jgi:serine/threonine-protein kinase HipA